MSRQSTRFRPKFLEEILLSAWGSLLLASTFDGALDGLVHPFYRPVCFVAGLALLLLATLRVFHASQSSQPVEAKSADLPARVITFLPVVLVLWLPSDGYSSSVILKRGLSGQALHHVPIFKSEAERPEIHQTDGIWNMSVIDAWLIARSEQERREFDSSKVTLTGQFFRSGETLHRALLYRLFITCCLADAIPIGITLELGEESPDEDKITHMSWIKVCGTLHFEKEEGRYVPFLRVDNLELIPRPQRPFLFR